MNAHLESEVANLAIRFEDFERKWERSASGIVLPGPGFVTKAEFEKALTPLVQQLEELSDLTAQAMRILDRLAGMED